MSKLQFRESDHKYFIENTELPSVSSKLKEFSKPFDKSIAKYVAKSKGVHENYILEEWAMNSQRSRDVGHRVHDYAQDYVLGVKRVPSCDQELGVKNFLDYIPSFYKVYMVEQPVHSDEFGFAGTPDLVLYNTLTDKYVIVDYKTNKNIVKNYKNQMMKAPFQDMLDHPLNKYYVQLSMYRICLEEIGLEVSDIVIVWLKYSEHTKQYFQLLSGPNLTSKLKNHYANNISRDQQDTYIY